MIYDKKTVERKAKVTIERVCGYTSDSLYCSDKPDLQDIKNSYGIEVVEDGQNASSQVFFTRVLMR